jgi:hypothetical protein
LLGGLVTYLIKQEEFSNQEKREIRERYLEQLEELYETTIKIKIEVLKILTTVYRLQEIKSEKGKLSSEDRYIFEAKIHELSEVLRRFDLLSEIYLDEYETDLGNALAAFLEVATNSLDNYNNELLAKSHDKAIKTCDEYLIPCKEKIHQYLNTNNIHHQASTILARPDRLNQSKTRD